MRASDAPSKPMPRRASFALVLLATVAFAASARALPEVADPTTGVVALTPAQLTAAYWIARQPAPDQPILDRAAITAQNARMRAHDPAIVDLATLPSPLPADWVRARIARLSPRPTRTLYDGNGRLLDAAALDRLQASLGLDSIPATAPLQYGLVVRRAALRTFPTDARVFSAPTDTDIDRFQESALFPGDAVAVLHASADRRWLFVASERYAAWIAADAVAIGDAAQVLGYAAATPYRVVTGAVARTAYAPGQPALSQLPLEMGLRLPLLAGWPPGQPVDGQLPLGAWVLQLPARDADGRLALRPALLPRSADSAGDYLALTPRTLITQAFKFLGERYGWGHDYAARDCSGFVSELYRSFGVLMPRNTGDQAGSPALDRIAFGRGDDHVARLAALRRLRAGDLVYMPGHVMVALGHADGLTYVIHDTAGGGWAGPDGQRVAAPFNGVVVTPLEPLLASDGTPYVDLVTSIQRMRPVASP